MKYQGKLTVCTIEGIRFSMQLAGPVVRFLAWVIDLFCIIVVMNVINFFSALLIPLYLDLAIALNIISYFLIIMGYSIFLEWYWRGQTVGKKLMGLRVVDMEGLPLTFVQVAIRNILRLVDSIPLLYLVGGVVSVLHPRNQRLGDIAASTVVIRIPALLQPDAEQLMHKGENSFANYPEVVARLKREVEPSEAMIAVEALIRRDSLEPGERVALFRELRDHFQMKTPFPEEALLGLSAEQYLRNIVNLLYARSTANPDTSQTYAASAFRPDASGSKQGQESG